MDDNGDVINDDLVFVFKELNECLECLERVELDEKGDDDDDDDDGGGGGIVNLIPLHSWHCVSWVPKPSQRDWI